MRTPPCLHCRRWVAIGVRELFVLPPFLFKTMNKLALFRSFAVRGSSRNSVRGDCFQINAVQRFLRLQPWTNYKVAKCQINSIIINVSRAFVTETDSASSFSVVEYEKLAEDTLQTLSECFEEFLEVSEYFNYDVSYSNGVLTVDLAENGTYVINKQTPNRQIWLSSPVSGPKRYDFINGRWIYKHDGTPLYELLSKELSVILKKEVDFTKCCSEKNK